MNFTWRSLVLTSVPGLIGGALFIYFAKYRWKIQLYGFLALAFMFVLVGVCMLTIIENQFGAVIVLYAISSLIFDFGKLQ